MAANNMKIRARLKDGIAEIKALMSHPMETGRRQNDRGETVPAHFIQMVTVALNGKTVMEAQWGTGISRNPYLTLHLDQARVGDVVRLSWVDNRGATEAIEAPIVAG
jgi:sulfur-oxidizing protein SoxZ